MIDIKKAKTSFKEFLNNYKDKDILGFNLKVNHTYNVMENSKKIAMALNLSDEDIKLAELIGLLHDIGRFEELTKLKKFDSIHFDHAAYGTKILFDENLIRNFIEDNSYDEVIKIVIDNHNELTIEENLDERSLLHSKIIRDADKLDNFRVKQEENIEEILSGIFKNNEEIENSEITDNVYNAVINKRCVDIHDRKTILDYWICVLAFVFDLNFKISYEIIKEQDYINILIDKFKYNNSKTLNQMEQIRYTINNFIDNKIKEETF